ncbi:hypothetical protein [Agarivorans litoreus]|uniref:hypothetical protein n=1 Tax=Agarivorans litoreus TaxID=1510455 RepID=UPI001C7D8F7B|nr:hypothetical protein [Agarivorans litoreus]
METLAQFAFSIGLAYLLLEFYCLPNSWLEAIQQSKFAAGGLYFRALLITLLFAGISMLFVSALGPLLAAIAALFIASVLIAGVSAYLPDRSRYYLGQQLAQLAVLLLLVVELSQAWPLVSVLFEQAMQAKVLVITFAYLLIWGPCSKVLGLILQRWSPLTEQPKQNLPMAGQAIGMVERSLVLTCVLLNQFAAIGFIVTAKSIFRFGDLKDHSDRKLTEYVMLGTLLSVAASVFIGLAAHALYHAL